MKVTAFFSLLFSLSALLMAGFAQAENLPIGNIKVLYGEVLISHDGNTRPVKLGGIVFEGDQLETGKDGHIGITFRDSTRIAIGPMSKLEVRYFVYLPRDKNYKLVIKLFDGTLNYISGIIGKLAPESISIETPTSTIAVRGTHLLISTQG